MKIGTISFLKLKSIMGKVFENNGGRLVILSDNCQYRLIATRRAISDVCNGIVRYYGSKWYIETHSKKGEVFMPVRLTGLTYIVRKKNEIIEMLSRSVQFTQAYREIVGK